MLRGVAALGLVSGHSFTHVLYLEGFTPLIATVQVLLSSIMYTVPLFVFIAGVVYSLHHSGPPSLGTFMKRRIRKIVPPYLFWSLLYIAFAVVFLGSRWSLYGSLVMLLTGNASRHLWYIPFMLQGYCLLPLLGSINAGFARRGRPWIFLGGAMAIQICWNLFVLGADRQFFSLIPSAFFRPLVSENILSRFFYLALGVYAGTNWERLLSRFREERRWRPWLYGFAPGAFLLVTVPPLFGLAKVGRWADVRGIYFIIPRIVEPLGWTLAFAVLLLAVWALRDFHAIQAGLKTLGTHSYGIYLNHVFIIVHLVIGLRALGITPWSWVFYPIVASITLLLSTLLCVAYARALARVESP